MLSTSVIANAVRRADSASQNPRYVTVPGTPLSHPPSIAVLPRGECEKVHGNTRFKCMGASRAPCQSYHSHVSAKRCCLSVLALAQ